MFDQVGRVMCIECASDMRTISSAEPQDIVFECRNQSCGHVMTLRLPHYPRPLAQPSKAA